MLMVNPDLKVCEWKFNSSRIFLKGTAYLSFELGFLYNNVCPYGKARITLSQNNPTQKAICFIHFYLVCSAYFADFILLLLNGLSLWCLLATRSFKSLQRRHVHHTFPVFPKVPPSFSSSTSPSTFIWSSNLRRYKHCTHTHLFMKNERGRDRALRKTFMYKL